MPAIVKELTLAVTPARVYKALTEPEEIGHWWTNDLNARPEVGTVAEFRFGEWGERVLRFEVAELDQNKKVSWICRRGPAHWTGTSVTWQLTPDQNGTRVVFTHDGFARMDEPYEQTRGNWMYFLESLQAYLEKGKGTPGLPPFV
jgi:uncharacterized protein YndB with AHSA1/START domain